MNSEIELTLLHALDLGLRMLQDDQQDAAENVYGSVLAHYPEQPDALH